MRRVIVIATIVAACAVGCSTSKSTPSGSNGHESEPTPATQPADIVTKIVAKRARDFRPVLAAERKSCGGSVTIRQTDTVAAGKCKQALADVSAYARNLVVVLAHVGEPPQLQNQVAETADAAEPITVVIRTFPFGDCLPSPPLDDPKWGSCDSAGRELAGLITRLEGTLASWK